MIRVVIEVADHPSWVQATKEAIACRLEELGTVRVVAVQVDKPVQTKMDGYQEGRGHHE